MPSRVNGKMIEDLRTKVVENVGLVRHPQKMLTVEILIKENQKSKYEVKYIALCEATIKIVLRRVSIKEIVSVIHENNTRHQGTKRKMAGLPARICMSHI